MVAPVAKRKFIKLNATILPYPLLYCVFFLHFLSIIFARSMSKDGLNRMEFEISELAKALGFSVISKDRNPA